LDCDTPGMIKADCWSVPNQKCAYVDNKCDVYNPKPIAPTPPPTRPPKGQGKRKSRTFTGNCGDYKVFRDCKLRLRNGCWFHDGQCHTLADLPCDYAGLTQTLCRRKKECRINPVNKSCYAEDKPPVEEGKCEGMPKELCTNPKADELGCLWLHKEEECITVKTLSDCGKAPLMKWCNLWGVDSDSNSYGARDIGCHWMIKDATCVDPSTMKCDMNLTRNECEAQPKDQQCRWFRNECYSPKRLNEVWTKCTVAETNASCDKNHCKWDPKAKAPWKGNGVGACVEATLVKGRTCAYYKNKDSCHQDWQAKYHLKCRWLEKKSPKCQPSARG